MIKICFNVPAEIIIKNSNGNIRSKQTKELNDILKSLTINNCIKNALSIIINDTYIIEHRDVSTSSNIIVTDDEYINIKLLYDYSDNLFNSIKNICDIALYGPVISRLTFKKKYLF